MNTELNLNNPHTLGTALPASILMSLKELNYDDKFLRSYTRSGLVGFFGPAGYVILFILIL